MKRIVRLETGSHYWWRQKHERIWRVCYIGNDPDDNQWLHPIGSPPMKIADMNLSCFDWQEINQPNTGRQVRREGEKTMGNNTQQSEVTGTPSPERLGSTGYTPYREVETAGSLSSE